ncbi:adhesion G protein-coupled receptor B2 [Trichonephila clavipes]|nr:adhesion G protein-coupled receptor B2 [Trichonephila clavipes]
MSVFSAVSDREPLRSSTAFRITILNPPIPCSANSHLISTDASSNTVINRNSGTLQFDLYQSQKRADNLMALHFKYDFSHMTATAGSDVVQSGRPIFDDFFQHLWPYIGNNTANVVFQMVKRLWLIRIDQ